MEAEPWQSNNKFGSFFIIILFILSRSVLVKNLLIHHFIKTSFDVVFFQYFYETSKGFLLVLREDFISTIFKLYANKSFEPKTLIH